MHAPADLLYAIEQPALEFLQVFLVLWSHPHERLQLDRHYRDLLADVVVELARDVRSLGVLRSEQAYTKVVNTVVARAEFRLASTRPLFGPPQPYPLQEQDHDECRLREEQYRDSDDVASVTLQDARHLEHDARSRRHARIADAPALKLPPVHLIFVQGPRQERDAVRALAVEDAHREIGHGLHLPVGTQNTAADSAPAHRPVDPRVNRSVGNTRQTVQVLHRTEVRPSGVLIED